jgi:hypothetical protein
MTRRWHGSMAAMALAGAVLAPPSVATARAGAAVTLTPPTGTVVHPGDRVEIRFTLENGSGIQGATFHVKDRVERIDGAGPFALTYDVPPASVGTIPINVETYGPGPETYRASGRLVVKPALPFVAITANPNQVDLSVGETSQLRILGRSGDGSEYDASSGGADTLYANRSGGDSIVKVGPDGQVEGRGTGSEIIVVRNGPLATAVLVHVTPMNHAPKMERLEDVTLTGGEYRLIKLAATDPDGNGVRFSIGEVPAWIRLTNLGGGRGGIELKPTTEDAGEYAIVVEAYDDGSPRMSDSCRIRVTVKSKGP